MYTELAHAPSFMNRDGRDKPGHDQRKEQYYARAY